MKRQSSTGSAPIRAVSGWERPERARPPGAEVRARRFRPELQALRALAVSLVVAYHFAPQWLPGGYVGVDVFFVISGYLMTAHLHREAQRTHRIRVLQFYARRIRRLLPAALLVLLAVVILTVLFVPVTLWPDFGRQVAASAVYVENWQLGSDATVYSASGTDSSPVQHYWSLSVEEQFYLVWPLVILLGVRLVVRSSTAVSRFSTVMIVSVIAIASLATSVVITTVAPAAAYFVTPTRIWELAAGGLVWLVAEGRTLPRAVTLVLACGGIAGVILTSFTFSSATPFPGSAALAPVLASCAVIAAGDLSGIPGLAPITRWRPVQYLGDISYSLYLWHWPLIILVPYATAGTLPPALRVATLALSIVLAAATKRFVEDRFRISPTRARRPTLRAYAWVAFGLAVVALPASVMSSTAQLDVDHAVQALDASRATLPNDIGAARLDEPVNDQRLIMSPLAAASDAILTDANGVQCLQENEFTRLTSCSFGSPTAAVQVGLVGDSHALAWLPALIELAKQNDWHLTTYMRAGCPLSRTYSTRAGDFDDACIRWVDAVIPRVRASGFQRLFIGSFSGSSFVSPDGDLGVSRGMAAAWRAAQGPDTVLDVLRDNPSMRNAGIADVPTCVAKHLAALSACDAQRSEALLSDPQIDAVKMTPGARLIDLTHYFCPDTCRSVIGGVIVYRDGQHLTRTYVQTLAPLIQSMLNRSG